MGNWAPPQKTGDCLRFPSQSSPRTLDLRLRSNSHPLGPAAQRIPIRKESPVLAIPPIRASASVGKSGSPASKPARGTVFGADLLGSRSHKGKGAPPPKTRYSFPLPSQSPPTPLLPCPH